MQNECLAMTSLSRANAFLATVAMISFTAPALATEESGTSPSPPDQIQFPFEKEASLAFDVSADGKIVVKKISGKIDAMTGTLYTYMEGVRSSSITNEGSFTKNIHISGDGNTVAYNTKDNHVVLYDTQTQTKKPETIDMLLNNLSSDGTILVGYRKENNINKAYWYDLDKEEGYYLDLKLPELKEERFKNYNQSEIMGVSDDKKTWVFNTYGANTITYPITPYFSVYRYTRAFIYHVEDARSTDMGTLRSDKKGNAQVMAISGDGSTAIGYAEIDKKIKNPFHAFSYDIESETMTDIGALHDAGTSRAFAVNEDGSVIVGYSMISGDITKSPRHAFYYYKARSDTQGTMTDLHYDKFLSQYTESYATSVNGDGSVVAGFIKKESNPIAVVWKVKNEPASDPPEKKHGPDESEVKPDETKREPEEPESTPEKPDSPATTARSTVAAIVGVQPTHKTFTGMARKDHTLHDLYRSALDTLANTHCALENTPYCIGAFASANRIGHDGHLVNTGIHGALRLTLHWYAGLSLAYLADDTLPGGIESRGRHTPGIGAYLRYVQRPDRSGLRLTASAARQKQKLTIRRATIGLTEPGRGDSEIEGTLIAFDGAYGITLDDATLISPTLGLNHWQSHRKSYRETRDAEFAAVYGKSGEKRTALKLGLALDHALSPRFSLHGDGGTRVVLERDRDPFTVHADYIGGGTFDLAHSGRKERFMPYARLGLSARWGARQASLARLSVAIARSDYGVSDARIAIGYDYRF